MDDGDDLDRLLTHPIHQNIVGMHDCLARPFHSARPMHQREIGQTVGAGFNRVFQALRGGHVAVGDIGDDLPEVFARPGQPDELQRCFLASMIFCASAMASSCGMGGRLSASDLATFARSHFS